MCLDVSLFQDLPHLLVLSYILVPPAAGDPQHPWVLCHEPPSLGVAQPVSVVSAVCLTWDVEDQGAASLGDPSPAFQRGLAGQDSVCAANSFSSSS